MPLITKINKKEVKRKLNVHIPRWEELPDFDIYNEQLIALVEQHLGCLFDGDDQVITKSMINNYVKWKVIPRPEKKKYKRKHIVYCIVISTLKPVLSIGEITRGIQLQTRNMSFQDAYNSFCECLEETMKAVFTPLMTDREPYVWEGFAGKAENVAVLAGCRSLAYKLMTEMVLKEGQIQEVEESTNEAR